MIGVPAMTQNTPGPQWDPYAGARPPQNQYAIAPQYGAGPHYGMAPYGGTVRTTDQRVNSAEVVTAWIFTVFSLGYFLPWAIAATRGKSNSAAIGLLNFFLGWTFLGWVAALVMACGSHQTVAGAPAIWINNAAPATVAAPHGYQVSMAQQAPLPPAQSQLPAAASPYLAPDSATDSGVWRP